MSLCIADGKHCQCQPQEGIFCQSSKQVAEMQEFLIAQARKEAAQRCCEIVQARLDAYPIDIFPPLSSEDIKTHGRLITRNSAAMGRHMAASLLDELRKEFNL